MRDKTLNLDNFIKEVEKLEKNEEFNEALELLEDVYKENSDSNLIRGRLIDLLFAFGHHLNDDFIAKYKEATRMFKRIVELDPDNYRAYYNLGIALHNMDQLEKALEMYQEAIKLNPDYKFSYYNIGLLYEQKQEFVLALKFHQKALKIDPHFRYAKQAIKEVREVLDSKTRFKGIEKLKSLLKMSTKIKIEMLQEILDIPKASLLEMLLNWGDLYDFKLDGDYLIINQDRLDEVLEDLENQWKN